MYRNFPESSCELKKNASFSGKGAGDDAWFSVLIESTTFRLLLK